MVQGISNINILPVLFRGGSCASWAIDESIFVTLECG